MRPSLAVNRPPIAGFYLASVDAARRLPFSLGGSGDVRTKLTTERMTMRASVYVVCAIVALATLVTTGVSDAQTADGTFVMVRKNFPTTGREEELKARFLKLVEFLRKAEPNAVFQLHRTTNEPVVFLWYEVFESQAALDYHLKVVIPAFQKEFGPTPEGILARPSESETYRNISK